MDLQNEPAEKTSKTGCPKQRIEKGRKEFPIPAPKIKSENKIAEISA
jgi:hypothetical protein